MAAATARIGDVLAYLLGKDWERNKNIPDWPPDIFGAAAYLLQISGAYLQVVKDWPPVPAWNESVEKLGKAWRLEAIDEGYPSQIRSSWKYLISQKDVPVASIKRRKQIWQTLVELCAAADVACEGIGIADHNIEWDNFEVRATLMLVESFATKTPSTLCRRIHTSKLTVLPKVHTSQKGITMRSLSHHLALCLDSDVKTCWCKTFEVEKGKIISRFEHGMAVLIIPHPLEMFPSQFKPAKNGRLTEMDAEEFGFFGYAPAPMQRGYIKKLKQLCVAARKRVGRLDGVIFPEMALQPSEYVKVRDALMDEISFLICGVYNPPKRKKPGENYAQLCTKFLSEYVEFRQDKHHRWFLEQNQICQYGLGATLDPNKKWWEYVDMKDRVITFVSLDAWLTFSVLICEDLARPDPVGNIIRAVGPNLVVALLQDGPQLANRWPARCATVLADDPGCSVLTLTSAGMAKISKPQATPGHDGSHSNVIALWKEKDGATREISLPKDAQGIVLSLTSRYEKEWSADGRHDNKAAATLKLAGVHALHI